MNIAAFTSGHNIPSTRFRLRQYVDSLQTLGITVAEYCTPLSAYPPSQHWARPFWALANITARLPDVLASHRYDLVFLQREFLSTFTTLERFTGHPRVLDVDDAIWAHPRGEFAARLAKMCDSIICGNNFLADQFSTWNPNVVVIPTAVDTERFRPINQRKDTEDMIIGWSGSSANFEHLYAIESALASVLHADRRVRLRIISEKRPRFSMVPIAQLDYIPWSPSNEVETIQTMNIGIMPLLDSVFARGKCSYKMLLYMSCGIPVVVSPVGMNQEILNMGKLGIGARTSEEWKEALLYTLSNDSMRQQLGNTGRQVVQEKFSTNSIAQELAKHLLSYKK